MAVGHPGRGCPPLTRTWTPQGLCRPVPVTAPGRLPHLLLSHQKHLASPPHEHTGEALGPPRLPCVIFLPLRLPHGSVRHPSVSLSNSELTLFLVHRSMTFNTRLCRAVCPQAGHRTAASPTGLPCAVLHGIIPSPHPQRLAPTDASHYAVLSPEHRTALPPETACCRPQGL